MFLILLLPFPLPPLFCFVYWMYCIFSLPYSPLPPPPRPPLPVHSPSCPPPPPVSSLLVQLILKYHIVLLSRFYCCLFVCLSSQTNGLNFFWGACVGDCALFTVQRVRVIKCACARSVPSLTGRVTTLVPGYWWAAWWVFFFLFRLLWLWFLALLLTKVVFVWPAGSLVVADNRGAVLTPPPLFPPLPPLHFFEQLWTPVTPLASSSEQW